MGKDQQKIYKFVKTNNHFDVIGFFGSHKIFNSVKQTNPKMAGMVGLLPSPVINAGYTKIGKNMPSQNGIFFLRIL